MSLAGVFVRTKYYFGWKLAEAAFVSSGLSWQGDKDPAHPWYIRWCFIVRSPDRDVFRDRVIAVQAMKIELSANVHALTNSWNIPTNNWLKRCAHLLVSLPRVRVLISSHRHLLPSS
jgi:hypothetical protein